MKKAATMKIIKGIAIAALAFVMLIGAGKPKPPIIHGNGDNHLAYTQK